MTQYEQFKLDAILNDTALSIGELQPEIAKWSYSIVALLQNLEKQADLMHRRDEYEAMLKRFKVVLTMRIDGGRWWPARKHKPHARSALPAIDFPPIVSQSVTLCD